MSSKNRIYIYVIIALIICGTGFLAWDVLSHREYIDAFTGATPQALDKKVPDGLLLKIKGLVKQEYSFNSRALELMAKIRIRTPEVTPSGDIMGAYIYIGIPVLYILEGVAPQKNKTDAFDRPLDMIIVFHSADNRVVRFSYGELVTADDSLPVTLAYDRLPILPSKDPEKYKGNKYNENLVGLKLIAPREKNTTRWLDNVTDITLENPKTPDRFLPKMEKGKQCISSSVICVENENQWPASNADLLLKEIKDWFRIGHGKGIRSEHLSTVTGYPLISYLRKNFPGAGLDNDFYVFIACDGYRSIFSSREIFGTTAGENLLMIETVDGQVPESGPTVAPVSDFFVDRGVRGVSHIVRVKFD